MAYSCYVWTPLVSMTATKYQRHGYVERRPFLPGERLSAAREMERALPGYRALAADLQNSRPGSSLMSASLTAFLQIYPKKIC